MIWLSICYRLFFIFVECFFFSSKILVIPDKWRLLFNSILLQFLRKRHCYLKHEGITSDIKDLQVPYYCKIFSKYFFIDKWRSADHPCRSKNDKFFCKQKLKTEWVESCSSKQEGNMSRTNNLKFWLSNDHKLT